MKKRNLTVLAVAALFTGGGAAQAQESFQPYFGAGAGQSEFDVGGGSFGAGVGVDDDSDTTWRVFGGGRAFELFGVELGYIDFGEAQGDLGTSAEATGIDLVAVGTLPLFEQNGHGFDLIAKAGGYWWDSDVDAIPGGDLEDGDDFDWTAGAGVQYTLSGTAAGGLGVRAEWQHYNDLYGSADTEVWMGSVFWQF